MQRLRRIAGLVLFGGSLTTAALGVARLTFGIAIGPPSGPLLPLGSSDPALPFAVAIILFLFGAALAPPGRRARKRFEAAREPPAELGAATPSFDASVHAGERDAASRNPSTKKPVR